MESFLLTSKATVLVQLQNSPEIRTFPDFEEASMAAPTMTRCPFSIVTSIILISQCTILKTQFQSITFPGGAS